MLDLQIKRINTSIRAYLNNRLVMRPSENLSAYGGVPPLGVLRKESLGLRRGQGGRTKMPGRRQAGLAKSGFLHVENVFFTDNAGIGLPLGIERVIWIGS